MNETKRKNEPGTNLSRKSVRTTCGRLAKRALRLSNSLMLVAICSTLLSVSSTECLGQTTAEATAIVYHTGFLVDVIVTKGGSGYSVPPQVSFIGGGGSGAAASAVISNGVVTRIIIDSNGAGYTSAPTVVVEPPLFDLTANLVGYWPFDGNANDASGKGQNGTVNGVASFVEGFVGSGSVSLGGGFIDFGDPSDGRFDIGLGEDFSVSLWVKTTMNSGFWYPMLLTKDLGWDNPTRVGWAIHFDTSDNGLPAFAAMVPAGWGAFVGRRVNDGQWHLLTVTKRGTMLAFYVVSGRKLVFFGAAHGDERSGHAGRG
jgi:hypothetical protein